MCPEWSCTALFDLKSADKIKFFRINLQKTHVSAFFIINVACVADILDLYYSIFFPHFLPEFHSMQHQSLPLSQFAPYNSTRTTPPWWASSTLSVRLFLRFCRLAISASFHPSHTLRHIYPAAIVQRSDAFIRSHLLSLLWATSVISPFNGSTAKTCPSEHLRSSSYLQNDKDRRYVAWFVIQTCRFP
jgi:hypothetical protein